MPTKKMTKRIEKTAEEWRRELTPTQYAVLREKATERPFSCAYESKNRAGTSV